MPKDVTAHSHEGEHTSERALIIARTEEWTIVAVQRLYERSPSVPMKTRPSRLLDHKGVPLPRSPLKAFDAQRSLLRQV
jgi:hypothetical protein